MSTSDQAINIGDTAKLLSGGPSMTVRGFEKEDSTPVAQPDRSVHGRDGLVRCVWFDEGGKINEHTFPAILLDVKSNGVSEDRRSGVQGAIDRQDGFVGGINREPSQYWTNPSDGRSPLAIDNTPAKREPIYPSNMQDAAPPSTEDQKADYAAHDLDEEDRQADIARRNAAIAAKRPSGTPRGSAPDAM